MNHGPSPAEALSLQAAAVIDQLAVALQQREPGLSLSEAVRRVMREQPHLAAAYEGDEARFIELSQRARTAELRQRQAAYLASAMTPRSGAPRPIGGPQDLRPGEVMLARLGPPSAGGGTFAERLA